MDSNSFDTQSSMEPPEVPEHILRFQVGELLPWKGLWFEVMEVTRDGLVLKSRKKIEKK